MTQEGKAPPKLVTAFGTPSGYTQFCVFLLHHLLRATVGDFDHAAASEIQHLRTSWGVRRHKSFLLFSDCPERSIVETYLGTRAPVVIFVEDPGDAALHAAHERGLQLPWAIRLTEQSLTTIFDLIRSEQALLYSRGKRWTLSEFLVTMAEHFGLPLRDADLEAIATAVAPRTEGALRATVEELYTHCWPKPEPSSGATVDVRALRSFEPVLARLRSLSKGEPQDEIEWPISMFIAGDSPNAAFEGSVDLLGPARCILYGPYLCLPRGAWGLKAEITIDENISGNELEVDVFQSDVLLRSRFILPMRGDLELRASFEISEPRIPVQLRLMTLQGSIEGRIILKRVQLVSLHPSDE